MKKRPNTVIAPLVIAGITIGFFTAAYRFVFQSKPEQNKADTSQEKSVAPTEAPVEDQTQN